MLLSRHVIAAPKWCKGLIRRQRSSLGAIAATTASQGKVALVLHCYGELVDSSISKLMSYTDLVRPEVLTQPVYEPGKPIETVAREYGLDPEAILKLASNENPLGPSPLATEAALVAATQANFYPDGGCVRLREALAAHHDLNPGQFIVGNGSNEIMVLLALAFLRPGATAVMGAHAFIAFKLGVLMAGATPVEVPMPELRHDLDALLDAITDTTRLVYLPNPNNPTGDVHSEADVLAFARQLPESVLFLYDEAYAEYLDDAPDLRPLIAEGRRILCTRTFSKIYGLAGYRIGYGYGDPELIHLLNRIRNPFNVNSIAQAAAIAALGDTAFVTASREVNAKGLTQLTNGLDTMGLAYVPSAGNFLLMEAHQPAALFAELQRRGIIVRPVAGYGLPGHVRISVGTPPMNQRLLETLGQLLDSPLANLCQPATANA